MSRLLGATLLATANGTSNPVVSFFCINACNDGSQPSYCVNNSTEYQGCKAAPAGCHLMAYQTLYNEGTCEAFQASQPLCFDQGHGADSGRCPDAAAFQLVMDRNRDFDRTYAAKDFHGVAQNLYQGGAILALDSAFVTDFARLYKSWDSAHVKVDRVPRKILGRDSVKHELGSWAEGGSVDRYTRWENSGEPYGWQIETDVDAHETGNENQPSDYTDAIRERYTAYGKLYEAGNFSGLASDLYTSDAVLALTSGVFVEHDGLENSLSQFYDEDPHRAFSVATAVGKDGADVVHDVGMVSTSSHKYYARWEKAGDVWKIAVQVEVAAGAPKPPTPPAPDDATCAAHAACGGLDGNCCPTDAGVTLDCCGAATCSSNPTCASLGLDGNCCPTDAGLMLECCSSSSVSV